MLQAGIGNNVLVGGGGENVINGGPGTQYIVGGGLFDVLRIASTANTGTTIIGGAGVNLEFAGAGTDTLYDYFDAPSFGLAQQWVNTNNFHLALQEPANQTITEGNSTLIFQWIVAQLNADKDEWSVLNQVDSHPVQTGTVAADGYTVTGLAAYSDNATIGTATVNGTTLSTLTLQDTNNGDVVLGQTVTGKDIPDGTYISGFGPGDNLQSFTLGNDSVNLAQVLPSLPTETLTFSNPLLPGMTVTAPGVPPGTTVASVLSPTAITLSNPVNPGSTVQFAFALDPDQGARLHALNDEIAKLGFELPLTTAFGQYGQDDALNVLIGGSGTDRIYGSPTKNTWMVGGNPAGTHIYSNFHAGEQNNFNPAGPNETLMFQGNGAILLKYVRDNGHDAVQVTIGGDPVVTWDTNPGIQTLGVQTLGGDANVTVDFSDANGTLQAVVPSVFVQDGGDPVHDAPDAYDATVTMDVSKVGVPYTLIGGLAFDTMNISSPVPTGSVIVRGSEYAFDELNVQGAMNGSTVNVTDGNLNVDTVLLNTVTGYATATSSVITFPANVIRSNPAYTDLMFLGNTIVAPGILQPGTTITSPASINPDGSVSITVSQAAIASSPTSGANPGTLFALGTGTFDITRITGGGGDPTDPNPQTVTNTFTTDGSIGNIYFVGGSSVADTVTVTNNLTAYITRGNGSATLIGGDGPNVTNYIMAWITGDNGFAYLEGGGGSNNITATIEGTDDEAVLSGGSGPNTMKTTIGGTNGFAFVDGGSGANNITITMRGSNGNAYVSDGSGANDLTLIGSGNYYVYGGTGTNLLDIRLAAFGDGIGLSQDGAEISGTYNDYYGDNTGSLYASNMSSLVLEGSPYGDNTLNAFYITIDVSLIGYGWDNTLWGGSGNNSLDCPTGDYNFMGSAYGANNRFYLEQSGPDDSYQGGNAYAPGGTSGSGSDRFVYRANNDDSIVAYSTGLYVGGHVQQSGVTRTLVGGKWIGWAEAYDINAIEVEDGGGTVSIRSAGTSDLPGYETGYWSSPGQSEVTWSFTNVPPGTSSHTFTCYQNQYPLHISDSITWYGSPEPAVSYQFIDPTYDASTDTYNGGAVVVTVKNATGYDCSLTNGEIDGEYWEQYWQYTLSAWSGALTDVEPGLARTDHSLPTTPIIVQTTDGIGANVYYPTVTASGQNLATVTYTDENSRSIPSGSYFRLGTNAWSASTNDELAHFDYYVPGGTTYETISLGPDEWPDNYSANWDYYGNAPQVTPYQWIDPTWNPSDQEWEGGALVLEIISNDYAQPVRVYGDVTGQLYGGAHTVTVTAPDVNSMVGASPTIDVFEVIVQPDAAYYFDVSGTTNATPGLVDSITVTARDSRFNVATGYTGTVYFTSSDQMAGLPADYTFTPADQGKHTFQVVFETSGPQSLDLADIADFSATGSLYVNVADLPLELTQPGTSNNLSGQNGWSGHYVPLANGVVDGQIDPGTGSFTASTHGINLPADSSTVTYSADVLAYSQTELGHVRSNNAFIGLTTTQSWGNGAVGWTPNTDDPNNPQWFFDARTLTGNSSDMVSLPAGIGFDQWVKLGVVVDRTTLQVYGTYDYIDSTGKEITGRTSQSFPITAAQAQEFGQVFIVQDYRNPGDYLGILADNFAVSAGSYLVHLYPSDTTGEPTLAAATVGVPTGALTVASFRDTQLGANDPSQYSATIDWGDGQTSAGTIVLNPDGSFSVQGSHTYTGAVGTNTVSVQIADSGGASLTSSSSITIVPGVATQFVLVPAGGPVGIGTPHLFTLEALDAWGNVASTYTGTVHFSSSDPNAILPADYTFTAADQGQHAFEITLGDKSNLIETTPTVTGSDNANGIGTTLSVTVIPPGSADQLSDPEQPIAVVGSVHQFNFTALDRSGLIDWGYSGTIHFTSSDPNAQLPADYTFNGTEGTHPFDVIFHTAGTQTITATDTANGLTMTETISVQPGATSQLVAYVSPVGALSPRAPSRRSTSTRKTFLET